MKYLEKSLSQAKSIKMNERITEWMVDCGVWMLMLMKFP